MTATASVPFRTRQANRERRAKKGRRKTGKKSAPRARKKPIPRWMDLFQASSCATNTTKTLNGDFGGAAGTHGARWPHPNRGDERRQRHVGARRPSPALQRGAPSHRATLDHSTGKGRARERRGGGAHVGVCQGVKGGGRRPQVDLHNKGF
jgi:hypothetical protein